jgi:fructose-1,6-bisphosphatase I
MSGFDHPDSIRNDVDSKTLSRVLMSKTQDADLVLLLNAMATACKLVSRSVRKAGIAGLYGAAGTANVTGDDQKKLDVLSNEMFVNALYNSRVCAVLVSEEDEEAIIVPEDIAGKFCVAFDPLDGSSNIDCNVSTGTIFSVWEKDPGSGPASVNDILRPGREMICAGYCAYGSATELVVTYYDKGIQRYTLDPSIGEFILTADNMQLPEVLKTIYSVNEGNYLTWDAHMQAAIDGFRLDRPSYTARYVGSMVADIHRTLVYGGVYLYPADAAKGNGKLRILYEGFPMAKIMEAAGGAASTGPFRGSIGPVLDIVPTGIHDKCPVIIGCKRDVDRVLGYYK